MNARKTVDYDMSLDKDMDREIAPIVEILRRGGIDTYESCAGGAGHAFAEPTVRFHGDRGPGFLGWAKLLFRF